MKILIVRHAQTEANKNKIIQHKDSGLSEEGFLQIPKLKRRLESEKIDLIISSPFKRCKFTSENLSDSLGVPLEFDELLVEKNDGDWIGKNVEDSDWNSLDGNFEERKAPKGENLIEVLERGKNFFSILKNKFLETDKTILLVSHSTFLRIFIGNLLGLNIKDSIFNFSLSNCSLTELDVNQKYRKGYKFKFINETKFLGD